MLWEILKASKGILVADFYADLWANIAGGGTPVDVFVEMIGTLPLYYDGKGIDLADYLISGNTVQDGTPTPEAPVDAVGSGVRTGNLVDESKVTLNTYITIQGITSISKVSNLTDYIDIGALPFVLSGVRTNDIMHSNIRALCYYDSNKNYISGTNYAPDIMTMPVRFSNIPQNAKYVRFAFDKAFENGIMLNLGSTALPYEPYGFKLPLTVNGTEYPIYLGTVPTTRRIKKQNVTISYMVQLANGNAGAVTEGFPSVAAASSLSKCNIAPYGTSTIGSFYVNPRNAVFVCAPGTTLSEARTLLSGAVIWYVLAEPETGIVNEPLMKIGDYADTVSAEQAGVTIPTVSGANVLDMASPVKPSEMYIKGKGIKPTGYGQLTDVNDVSIIDKDGRPIYVHGQ